MIFQTFKSKSCLLWLPMGVSAIVVCCSFVAINASALSLVFSKRVWMFLCQDSWYWSLSFLQLRFSCAVAQMMGPLTCAKVNNGSQSLNVALVCKSYNWKLLELLPGIKQLQKGNGRIRVYVSLAPLGCLLVPGLHENTVYCMSGC